MNLVLQNSVGGDRSLGACPNVPLKFLIVVLSPDITAFLVVTFPPLLTHDPLNVTTNPELRGQYRN